MWFSSKRRGENVAVIDIGSASVGGALAYLPGEGQPQVVYSARVALGEHDAEEQETSMMKALVEIGDRVVREGMPHVREISDSHHVNRIVVSVSSPWQETHVFSKEIRKDTPFIFTQAIERSMIGNEAHADGKLVTESTVATLLNGYFTQAPYGKKASRARIHVLSSALDAGVIESIGEVLRKHFHTKRIEYTGFAIPSYQVLRTLYPHERDMLIVSVTGEATDVASAKRGHLIDVGCVGQGTNALIEAIRHAGKAAQAPQMAATSSQSSMGASDGYIDPARNLRFTAETEKAERAWLSGLMTLLKEFAGRHALPRTLFLIADEEVRGFLKQELEDESLRSLWLSDEPLSVIPVLPSQFTPFVTVTAGADGDVPLELLTLFATQSR